MNRTASEEIAPIAQRHEAEALLEEALQRQTSARTWVGKFVASKVVAYRERKADQLVRSIED